MICLTSSHRNTRSVSFVRSAIPSLSISILSVNMPGFSNLANSIETGKIAQLVIIRKLFSRLMKAYRRTHAQITTITAKDTASCQIAPQFFRNFILCTNPNKIVVRLLGRNTTKSVSQKFNHSTNSSLSSWENVMKRRRKWGKRS